MFESETKTGGNGEGGIERLRRRCHRALALSDAVRVDSLYEGVASGWSWRFVRKPESGLVMARGRIGGGGAPFNLGEVTVTRASVALEGGPVGHALVQGRNERKAAIVAVFDAAAQHTVLSSIVERDVVAPLEAALADAAEEESRKAAATQVEFFTMVRGED